MVEVLTQILLMAVEEEVSTRSNAPFRALSKTPQTDMLLAMLGEVRDGAVSAQQGHLRSLHITLTRALPKAVTFVGGVERVQ